jgi:two-component system sensor histidine kinase CreC
MSLRNKILVVFAGGLLAGFLLYTYRVSDMLRQSYGQSVEEIMIDVAQMLAATIEVDTCTHSPSGSVVDGPGTGASASPLACTLSTERLARVFAAYKARPFAVKIFDAEKRGAALDVYVTDARGIVLYSSEDPGDVGRDFSRWRDVHATLAGGYGARSTRRDPADKRTSVFHIGAPIRDPEGRIVGMVSLIKKRESVAAIVEGAGRRMLGLGVFVVALVLVMGTLLFRWITLPLARLEAYVRSVSAGRETPLPPLRGSEIAELGRAFEEMRVAVAGKKEIESMAQALSHELKSPLSAIQGAAELLQEPSMDEGRRERFLANIVGESQRAREIVERLLQITALEAKSALDHRERIALRAVVDAASEALLGLYSPRRVRVTLAPDGEGEISGDPFLVPQSVRNVIQNAVEFSPDEGVVEVRIERREGAVLVVVEDDGPGIPAFAQERIFEKFFSLERPSTGRKGSGLGLSFVREVMALHGGRVRIESPRHERGGTRAILSFPA